MCKEWKANKSHTDKWKLWMTGNMMAAVYLRQTWFVTQKMSGT
jgi:hypothetical protein